MPGPPRRMAQRRTVRSCARYRAPISSSGRVPAGSTGGGRDTGAGTVKELTLGPMSASAGTFHGFSIKVATRPTSSSKGGNSATLSVPLTNRVWVPGQPTAVASTQGKMRPSRSLARSPIRTPGSKRVVPDVAGKALPVTETALRATPPRISISASPHFATERKSTIPPSLRQTPCPGPTDVVWVPTTRAPAPSPHEEPRRDMRASTMRPGATAPDATEARAATPVSRSVALDDGDPTGGAVITGAWSAPERFGRAGAGTTGGTMGAATATGRTGKGGGGDSDCDGDRRSVTSDGAGAGADVGVGVGDGVEVGSGVGGGGICVGADRSCF